MKQRCASLLVLFALFFAAEALAAGGASGPIPQACFTSLVEPVASVPGRVLDPVLGIRQASDCGTCASQFQACKIGCGCSPFGPPICVDTFTCNPADPCGAVCICRPL